MNMAYKNPSEMEKELDAHLAKKESKQCYSWTMEYAILDLGRK